MAKIGEEFIYDDKEQKIIIKKTHDYTDDLHRAKVLRETIGEQQKGAEKKLVGTIPMSLIAEWLKEAGIKWDDPARDDVIKRKIMSGEFDKFRVWKGKY